MTTFGTMPAQLCIDLHIREASFAGIILDLRENQSLRIVARCFWLNSSLTIRPTLRGRGSCSRAAADSILDLIVDYCATTPDMLPLDIALPEPRRNTRLPLLVGFAPVSQVALAPIYAAYAIIPITKYLYMRIKQSRDRAAEFRCHSAAGGLGKIASRP
jgi:hypothetical protein